MLISRHYKPGGFLGELVQSISYLKGAGTGIAFQRMYQVIVINLGTNFKAESLLDTRFEPEELKAGIWLNGIQETPMAIQNDNEAEMYSIMVKPGMLPFLCPLPAYTTNELSLEAAHWTDPEIYNLREQLQICPAVEQGFLLIENYLNRILQQRSHTELEKIKWLGKALRHSSVSSICGETGMTRKKLLQESEYFFGSAVKKLQGIIRLNKTLADIASGKYKTLSSLHTYYDQAHFINDFRSRCGITPLQFRQLCRQFPHIRHSPNFIPLSKETFLQFQHK